MADKNPLFDLLVAESDDIQSLIAYSLYKRHKREWANSIRERHGRDPTEEEDIGFAHAVATQSSLDRFQQSAGSMLVAFANQVVEDERPSIEEDAIPKRVETAVTSVKRSSSFLRNVLSSVIASGVTICILVALTIAAGMFGIDVVDESHIIDQFIGSNTNNGEAE